MDYTAAIFFTGMLFFAVVSIYHVIRRYRAEDSEAQLRDINDMLESGLHHAERECESLEGARDVRDMLNEICEDLEKEKAKLVEENERLRETLSEYWLASN